MANPKEVDWTAVERLFHEAVERPRAERGAFLASACGGDEALRREVESLLARDDEHALDEPALDVAAREIAAREQAARAGAGDGTPSLVGRRLRGYEVLSLLGAGGMGEVYRARDTTLGREVALKLLPRELSSDPERLRRLEREARVLASIEHPSIAVLHSLEEAEGRRFLVMELVAGPTLAERLHRGRLPVAEALAVGRQMAEALEAAHGRGVIHRDLKPGNVKLTPDGRVKLLDFGLAKALTEAEGEAVPKPESETTRDGAVLGTPAYMSPEQARGEAVDRRTDIWSFGCSLYEALSGRRAFAGTTTSDTLAAVLDREPDWNALPERTPAGALRVLRRCLTKDVRQRLQHIGDARLELEEAAAGRDERPEVWPRRRVPWFVAAAVVALTAVGVAVVSRRSRPPAVPLELARLTYDTGLTTDPTISADGKLVAYASDRSGEGHLDIWVQLENQPQPARLTRDATDDWQPGISPDGSRVAFRSERDGGGIYVVGTLGGEERKVADRGIFPRFSPDGSQIAYLEDVGWAPQGLKMFVVGAEAGPPRPFQPDFGVYPLPGSIGPLWSPDGRFLLFSGMNRREGGRADWWVAPVDGGPAVSTGAASLPRIERVQYPCGWVGGHVLVAAGSTIEGTNLYRVPISPGDWKITGPPVPLTAGTGLSHLASVAADGRIVIPRFNLVAQLWSIDRAPRGGSPSTAPMAITHDATPKVGFSLARDAPRLAYSTYSGQGGQRRLVLRLHDLATGAETTPVRTRTEGTSLNPHLNADGTLVSWEDRVEGHRAGFVGKAGDSSGREVCRGCGLWGFSSDSRRVLADFRARGLVWRDIASGAEAHVLEPGDGTILDADLSSDDRWVAVVIGRPDGSLTLQLAPAGGPPAPREQWIPVAESMGRLASPRWSPDGSRIYFIADSDGFLCIWTQELDPATKRPRGEPVAVFHAHGNPWRTNFPRFGYSLAVGRERIIFNAVEITGNVLTGRLAQE